MNKMDIREVLYNYFQTITKADFSLKLREEYDQAIYVTVEKYKLDNRVRDILIQFGIFKSISKPLHEKFFNNNITRISKCTLTYSQLCAIENKYNVQDILYIFLVNPFIIHNISFHKIIDLMTYTLKIFFMMTHSMLSHANYKYYNNLILNFIKRENYDSQYVLQIAQKMDAPAFHTFDFVNLDSFSKRNTEYRVFFSKDPTVLEKNMRILSSMLQNFYMDYRQYIIAVDQNIHHLIPHLLDNSNESE